MTLIKYEIFRTVVETGSLSKAAEVVGLTQSAVSHAIASLESDFGFSLITRGRLGIHLTSNGEKMLHYMREILKWNELMMQEVSKINGLETGIVRIGTLPSVSIQWLPMIIKQFNKDFPYIEIKLFEGDYDKIDQWISDGTIDFGFMSLPVSKAYEVIPLKKDRLLCILPDTHPLNQQDIIYLDQLKDESFIMPKSSIDKDVRRILKEHKIKPKIKYEIAEDQAIISMVQNGLGISILPEMILYRIHESIRIIPLEGNYYRSIGIAATSLRYMSPGSKKLIEFIQEWLK
ncbi:LysR family transcriptional regulator [Peribacillus butanolivorans]|uniref:LysR family transcriptional regulator n=1 Tax=Peribacillus butanolivorans TaxID=421767 RepID=UPI00368D10F4